MGHFSFSVLPLKDLFHRLGSKKLSQVHLIFLNLPFLANFYKITGMSGTITTFDKLTNLPLVPGPGVTYFWLRQEP